MAANPKLNALLKKSTYVDYRFTDLDGTCHHVAVPTSSMSAADLTRANKNFDGSSIAGWRGIEDSDMQLRPDWSSAFMDPFIAEPTLAVFCDVILPDGAEYMLSPRSVGAEAVRYLKKSGAGDTALFGPEPEFFVFDSARWKNDMNDCFYQVRSEEGAWASDEEMDGFNGGHRPKVKGGYMPVPPQDSLADVRNEMCKKLEEAGVQVEVHHHEVATGGQCEIGSAAAPLVKRGDFNQILKYVVHNVAKEFGQTATFMPKPMAGDNGSGMHVHQSIVKNGKNTFTGKLYAGLSQEALWYIGGILKHGRALNAFTNPSTNSYKRLMPGFEAPVKLAYSARNRSAAIRIPLSSDKARRIETRFPDPTANPYLCFAALLVAGLDGIKNKIDPGKATDFNLYASRRQRDQVKITELCATLHEALNELDRGRDFLLKSGVFSEDLINSYLRIKWAEVSRFREAPHPIEYEMYYSR